MKSFIIILISLLYISTSFAQNDIYSKLENQNQKDIIFNQSITRDDLNDRDKIILDKISNKLSNIYWLTENSANYKYNVAVIVKKINTFLKTKLIDKGRTYDSISTTSKQAVLILNVYIQWLMKSITGNIITQTNIINTSTWVTNATYKWIPYNKDWKITISKDLVIKQFWKWLKSDYAKTLFDSLKLWWSMSYTQNIWNKDVWIDIDNIGYHRYYSSEWWKAQLKELIYSINVRWIVSITEWYSNWNSLTFTSTVYANESLFLLNWKIWNDSFWEVAISDLQNWLVAWHHWSYDSRIWTMYIPKEYYVNDVNY